MALVFGSVFSEILSDVRVQRDVLFRALVKLKAPAKTGRTHDSASLPGFPPVLHETGLNNP
eukprot:913425-Amphidinium_carterae.1